MDFDCVVIGGSANGSQSADVLAKRGHRVAIIEEHPFTGLPEHCSGLFSYWGLKKIKSMPPDEIVFNYNIYGSRIISPNGRTMTVKKNYRHALVCDRAAFDKFLFERAVKGGAIPFQPYKAIDVRRVNNHVEVDLRSKDGDKETLTTKMLISAEGLKATISQKMGLEAPTPHKVVNASQFYMYNLNDVDETLVEVMQSRRHAPDFFAWLIPMSNDSAKLGLGTSKNSASKELEKMIKTHPVLKERCEGADIRRRTAGRIPTTGTVKKTYAPNFLVTGDAGGQTKPTTGGGVILGGIAARYAGLVASNAIEQNRFEEKFLSIYQRLWRKEMWMNLKLMLLVRKYMNTLQDGEVNEFFELLELKGITQDIEKFGHVDNQGKLVMRFMRTPKLYRFYMKTSGRLFKSLMSL